MTEAARAGGVQSARHILATDPVCDGRVTNASVDLLGTLIGFAHLSPMDAVQLGKARERDDVVAFLRKRQRAALTVANKNPEEADRAHAIAAQIGIEIEAIEQGLHDGDGLMAEILEPGESMPAQEGAA